MSFNLVNLFRILHLAGIFLLFAALGGIALRKLLEGDGGPAKPGDRASRLAGATHGVALLLLLVTGFGMLGALRLGFPPWAWGKVLLWLAFGALAAFARKSAAAAAWIWWLAPLLGVLAAYLALFKPAW
jgi:hypothetical protein